MTAFAWTDERVRLLTMYREIGMSYGWIAREFGTTRNTVAGKWHGILLGRTPRKFKRRLARRQGYVPAHAIELEAAE